MYLPSHDKSCRTLSQNLYEWVSLPRRWSALPSSNQIYCTDPSLLPQGRNLHNITCQSLYAMHPNTGETTISARVQMGCTMRCFRWSHFFHQHLCLRLPAHVSSIHIQHLLRRLSNMNIQLQRSDSPWNIQNSSTFSHQDHVPTVFPLATMHITSIHHVYFLLSCARLCMSNQCSVHLRTILQACLDICLQVHLCSSYLAPIEPYHGCKDISVCVHLTLYSPSSTYESVHANPKSMNILF